MHIKNFLLLHFNFLHTPFKKIGSKKMMARAMMIGFLLLIYCIDISTSVRNISTNEYALLAFKAQIINDPDETVSTNWTKVTEVCSWIGVSCSTRHQRVVSLNLKSLKLRGSILEEIGNLSLVSWKSATTLLLIKCRMNLDV